MRHTSFPIDPRKLIHPYHVDLFFKIPYSHFYVNHNKVVPKFVNESYLHHEYYWNGFHEKPVGKHTAKDFIDAFHATMNDIMSHGFDPKRPIRVTRDEKGKPWITEGSHRTSACVTLAKTIYLNYSIRTSPVIQYDAEYFIKKNVDSIRLEHSLYLTMRYYLQLSVLILWPKMTWWDRNGKGF